VTDLPTSLIDAAHRTIECSISIRCTPERLRDFWHDVSSWPQWDPDTRCAELNGPFALGTQGRLTPTRGRAVRMVVSSIGPGPDFTVSCPVLGTVMHFDHTCRSENEQLRITHRLRIEGLLAGALFRLLNRQVSEGLPVTLSRLKAHCETRY
jgi:hypothetical protein